VGQRRYVSKEHTVPVRDLIESDIPAVRSIFEKQGIDCEFPDLMEPLALVKKVYHDSNGEIVGATIARIEAEVYLFIDPQAPAKLKVEVMAELNAALCHDSYMQGLDCLVCRIPVDIEKRFKRRLKLMGWNRDRPGWAEYGIVLTGT
jgi:hypothetical protein